MQFFQLILASLIFYTIYYLGSLNYLILTLPSSLILIGLLGLFFSYQNKNIIIFIMCVEVALLGLIAGLIVLCIVLEAFQSNIFALVFLALAAAETAIGLGLIINISTLWRTLNFNIFRKLRG